MRYDLYIYMQIHTGDVCVYIVYSSDCPVCVCVCFWSKFIYILYIYMCVYMYTFIYICIHILHICKRLQKKLMHVCINTHTHTRTHTHTHTHTHTEGQTEGGQLHTRNKGAHPCGHPQHSGKVPEPFFFFTFEVVYI
jgi:hypothetical protein